MIQGEGANHGQVRHHGHEKKLLPSKKPPSLISPTIGTPGLGVCSCEVIWEMLGDEPIMAKCGLKESRCPQKSYNP